MSDATNADEAEYSEADTDWLAHDGLAYGYGFTKEQALMTAARYSEITDDPESDTLTVDLVEHVGGASTGPGRWEVETLVSRERVEVAMDDYLDLRAKARAAHRQAELTLDGGTVTKRD